MQKGVAGCLIGVLVRGFRHQNSRMLIFNIKQPISAKINEIICAYPREKKPQSDFRQMAQRYIGISPRQKPSVQLRADSLEGQGSGRAVFGLWVMVFGEDGDGRLEDGEGSWLISVLVRGFRYQILRMFILKLKQPISAKISEIICAYPREKEAQDGFQVDGTTIYWHISTTKTICTIAGGFP